MHKNDMSLTKIIQKANAVKDDNILIVPVGCFPLNVPPINVLQPPLFIFAVDL